VDTREAVSRISHSRWPDAQLFALAEEVGLHLKQNAVMLASAESCTGGLVAKLITDVAGSSAWFDRSFITYTNSAKQQMLDVPAPILNDKGAVSREVVLAMAEATLDRSQASVSVALSGIAGPAGATPGKPVGTVWIAWGRRTGSSLSPELDARCFWFDGDRDTVRYLAAQYALHGIIEQLNVS